MKIKERLVSRVHGIPADILQQHVMYTDLEFISMPVSEAVHTVLNITYFAIHTELRRKNKRVSPRDICSVQEILRSAL